MKRKWKRQNHEQITIEASQVRTALERREKWLFNYSQDGEDIGVENSATL